MTDLDWIYISSNRSEGSHDGGWQTLHAQSEGLPPAADLVAGWNAQAFSTKKVAVVLEDDFLYPMRIALDGAPPRKELHHFLLWKLKRHLPFPVEQVSLRYLPLTAPHTYLTFALPNPWLEALDRAFSDRGVHCGYVGGLFSTLLENATSLRSDTSVGFFGDFYLLTKRGKRGDYEHFSTRRLPYGVDGKLDLDTLIEHDLEPVCREAGSAKVSLYNLAPELDRAFTEVFQRLKSNHASVWAAVPEGTALQRFQSYMGLGGES